MLPYNNHLINGLKDILLRLHAGEPSETIQTNLARQIQDVDMVTILLIVQELKNGNHGITSTDVRRLFRIYQQLPGHSADHWYVPDAHQPGHPLQIFQEENRALQALLNKTASLMETIEKNQPVIQKAKMEQLKEQMTLLGQFYNHYNRKEKLIFPILERYKYFTPCRIMWGDDDRIRTLYKGTKRMMEQLPKVEFLYVIKSYRLFEEKIKEMLFEEEAFLLPLMKAVFTENDWLAIASESDAFGYCLVVPQEEWLPGRVRFAKEEKENNQSERERSERHLPFGGGYLTIKEADIILNNLPLEITFVDKNDLFKYFNEKVKASDMMFVRTPTSIGRNVANCHPPKSLKKVMQLIRDLKTKKRTSETMWFKKEGNVIHITYKGVFDENGEYVGILEYVQDIQPFLDLPREVKKEVSELEKNF